MPPSAVPTLVSRLVGITAVPLTAQGVPHAAVMGAFSHTLGPYWYTTLCGLSITLGAILYNFFETLKSLKHLDTRDSRVETRQILDGVDVTDSVHFNAHLVREAVKFAADAHAGQSRKTGEPYVTHCIETALIVERNLPQQREDCRHQSAVIAALLHDTIDDTGVDAATIASTFDQDIADMVTKVTKLSQVNQLLRRDKRRGLGGNSAQWHLMWQQLKRMMVDTVLEEPLVILIKLADRLHNMRTVYALAPDKQQAVAEETLEVWCSMAEYLGWDGIKSEMEDLCFAVLQPTEFTKVSRQIDHQWKAKSRPLPSTTARGRQRSAAASRSKSVVKNDMQRQGGEDQHKDSSSLTSSIGRLDALVSSDVRQAEVLSSADTPSSSRSQAPAVLRRYSNSNGRPGSPPLNPDVRLTSQQKHLKALLSTVTPFDVVGFKGGSQMGWSTRRGLEVLDSCADQLHQELMIGSYGAGLAVYFQGRLKSLYSVYKKMQRKKCAAHEVYDARALRVIVDDEGGERLRDAVGCCYRLMKAVHTIWKPILKEFDDYIANPKPSAYQALHTAVKGPDAVPMEVQIKTASMHDYAEHGGAAHWAYKEVFSEPSKALRQQTGYEGQPLLRIAPDRLRYGVVLRREALTGSLVVGIKSGGTTDGHPTRLPRYDSYSSLAQYCRDRAWVRPGQGDFNVRLEEYVLGRDGRYHRKDHLGHIWPAVSLTLLEGYDEEAHAHARAEDAEEQSQAAAAAAAVAAADQYALHSTPAAVASRADKGVWSTTQGVRQGRQQRQQQHGVRKAGAAGSAVVLEQVEEKVARQMRETYAKTQHLRAIVEWGKAAYGDAVKSMQGSEISILIWPGGRIENFPRGTTAGSILRHKGVAKQAWPPRAGSNRELVNVNNRMVHENTVLDDGDLVILTRDKVKL